MFGTLQATTFSISSLILNLILRKIASKENDDENTTNK